MRPSLFKISELDNDSIHTAVASGCRISFSVIIDAIEQYLNFGLTPDCIDENEFISAHSYLFVVRSTDKFPEELYSYTDFDEDGICSQINLKTEDLQNMCFDRHFYFSGLATLFNMEFLLKTIKERRTNLVKENKSYLKKSLDISRFTKYTERYLITPKDIPSITKG